MVVAHIICRVDVQYIVAATSGLLLSLPLPLPLVSVLSLLMFVILVVVVVRAQRTNGDVSIYIRRSEEGREQKANDKPVL